MNILNWMIWGFIGTIVLTGFMVSFQSLRFTRMNFPLILGTIFVPNRDKAQIIGLFIHLLNGWIFSFVHILIFGVLHIASWYVGSITGLLHGCAVLTIVLPALPGIHPRMASEFQQPSMIRQIEPPGFMGRHYGIHTPISILISHIVYGIILGTFYYGY